MSNFKNKGNTLNGLVWGLLAGLILLYYGKIYFVPDLGSYSQDRIIYCLTFFLVILAMIPIILPISRYIKYGKQNRINDVKGFFDSELISDYFEHFWEGDKECKDNADAYRRNPNDDNVTALKKTFESKIFETFGQDRIKLAVYFLCLTSFVELFFAIEGGLQLARDLGGVAEKPVHFPLEIKPDITSLAAIFGAYTWITSDAIYRYRRNDLNSSDVLWYSLRLIVAIPLGEAVARFAPLQQTIDGHVLEISSSGPLLAFVVSMFSFSSIQQMLGGFLNRAYKLDSAVTEARDDVLIKLPGIDQSVADRLVAEGITTMSQLVGTDPVLLCSRTAIPFRCILDYVNSAILWKIVGANLLILREFGWQGSSQVIAFSERKNQSLEEAIAHFITMKQQLEIAKNTLDKTPNGDSLKAATESYDSALSQVRAIASQSETSIFDEMADKTKMKKSAFPEIQNQIMTDRYARFIYDIGYGTAKVNLAGKL